MADIELLEPCAKAQAAEADAQLGEAAGERLHIVHVITRLLLAGAEENTIATCLHQVGRGHRVTVLHGRDTDPSWQRRFGDRITFLPFPTLVQPIRPLADLQTYRRLRTYFRQELPDVVHTHGSKAGVIGRIAAAAAGVKLVVHTIHIAPFLAVGRNKGRFFRTAERIAARHTDLLIAVSEGMQQAYLEAGIGNGIPIPVVHSGMPIEQFRSARAPQDWAQRIGGWPVKEKPLFILKLASFEQRKRHLPLIQTIAPYLRSRPNVCLLLAGDGPERPGCEAAAASLGVAAQVRFLGHDPAPWELVALADLCVHASEREGLPRSGIQAIAGGKPLIVTRLPGIGELIENDRNGLITDSDEIADLAAALFNVVDHPEKLARLQEGARRTDVSSWAESRMGERIERAYAIARTGMQRKITIQTVEFFGLPGSGKTTIARELHRLLRQERGSVQISSELMGDDLSLLRRTGRRLRMAARVLARSPGRTLPMLWHLTKGRGTLKDAAKTRWNFLSVMAMQSIRRERQVVVIDQGLAQAIWTSRVQHGADAAPIGAVLDHALQWPQGTLFVRVDAPVALARERLGRRERMTSRFQRDDIRDDDLRWAGAAQTIGTIERELGEALSGLGLGGRMIRIASGAGLSPAANASLVQERLEELERQVTSAA